MLFLISHVKTCKREVTGKIRYFSSSRAGFSDFLAALFSEKVRNMSPDEIRIPPEPPGRCSSQLQVNTPPQL